MNEVPLLFACRCPEPTMYKCILFYTNKLIVIPGNTQNRPCALSPSVMSFKEKNVLADFGIIESIISAGNATGETQGTVLCVAQTVLLTAKLA